MNEKLHSMNIEMELLIIIPLAMAAFLGNAHYMVPNTNPLKEAQYHWIIVINREFFHEYSLLFLHFPWTPNFLWKDGIE